jgi:hypothetical protein
VIHCFPFLFEYDSESREVKNKYNKPFFVIKFLVVKPKVMMRERVGLWDSRSTEQLAFMKLAGGKEFNKKRKHNIFTRT